MIVIYTTCKNLDEAKKISSHLLKKKLCGCTNFFKIKSMYHWKGKIVNDNEVGLIIKTLEKNYEKISKEIKKTHSYSTPCIISLNIENVDIKYLNWLKSCIK